MDLNVLLEAELLEGISGKIDIVLIEVDRPDLLEVVAGLEEALNLGGDVGIGQIVESSEGILVGRLEDSPAILLGSLVALHDLRELAVRVFGILGGGGTDES